MPRKKKHKRYQCLDGSPISQAGATKEDLLAQLAYIYIEGFLEGKIEKGGEDVEMYKAELRRLSAQKSTANLFH